jgi:hypothetical protein
MVGIGSIWFRIGTGGGLMWTLWWSSGFHKMLGSSRVAAQLEASQEGLSSMSEWEVWLNRPITVAARSKSWTILARSNTGFVGSNPIRGMDVYVRLFCVCVVLCVGSGLATVWSPPAKESYRLCKRWRNSKSGQGPTEGCTAIEREKRMVRERLHVSEMSVID